MFPCSLQTEQTRRVVALKPAADQPPRSRIYAPHFPVPPGSRQRPGPLRDPRQCPDGRGNPRPVPAGAPAPPPSAWRGASWDRPLPELFPGWHGEFVQLVHAPRCSLRARPRSSRCPAISTARTSLPAEPTQGRTAAVLGYWSLSLSQPQAHAEHGPGAGALGPSPPGPPPPGPRRAQVWIPPEMGSAPPTGLVGPARGLGLRGPGFPLLLTPLPSGDDPHGVLLWGPVPSRRCCNKTRYHRVASHPSGYHYQEKRFFF